MPQAHRWAAAEAISTPVSLNGGRQTLTAGPAGKQTVVIARRPLLCSLGVWIASTASHRCVRRSSRDANRHIRLDRSVLYEALSTLRWPSAGSTRRGPAPIHP